MIFDILTLFPDMFDVFNHSIIKRAREKSIIDINVYNIRDFTKDKHKKVDDYPYGGGAGMVMQAQPVYDAVEHIISKYGYKPFTLLMSPRGAKYDQSYAKELSLKNHVLIICGHYEGIDERIMPLIDMEISIGDYILTGGEIACMAIIDSAARLVPGVLNKSESYEFESFSDGLLEYPQYTRPEVFNGLEVPEVLLSGHHENIRKWRKYQSLKITYEKRPEIIDESTLNKEDLKFLNDIKRNYKR